MTYYKSNNKNNDTNDIIYLFKKLLINISKDLLPNIDITNKLFHSLFGAFQNIEFTNIINLLTNNIFKYQIRFIDDTVALINLMLYNFTVLTKLQYDKSEFKRLLTDWGSATWSKIGIGQLKTL